MQTKLNLNWRKKAILVFVAVLVILSLVLAGLAIREAEREKLLKEREIVAEQQRASKLVIDQVIAVISESENRVARIVRSFEAQSKSHEFVSICQEIRKTEDLVTEIFFMQESGEVVFPLAKPLFQSSSERTALREIPIEIETNDLWRRAEAAEFKIKNYSLALEAYQELLRLTNDPTYSAILLSHIGRCYLKLNNFQRAIKIYDQIIEIGPNDAGLSGIPLRMIALYQLGKIYKSQKKKIESTKFFLDLYRGLLSSEWPLGQNQFHYYRGMVITELEQMTTELGATQNEDDLVQRWEKLKQLEFGQLKKMEACENIRQKIIPLIYSRRAEFEKPAESFLHFSAAEGKKNFLISYIPMDDRTGMGFGIDEGILAKKVFPVADGTFPFKEGWHVRVGIFDSSADLDSHLTHTANFPENFPPWTISIFQDEPDIAEKQFQSRRNIYLVSVIFVMIAILFGGFLAIKSTAKELEVARLKEDFVATVSHELRTPLTSIRYLAELLQRGRVKEEKRRQEYYDTLTTESDRLGSLVENILDFSKMEAGIKAYQFEESDLGALAEDVITRFQNLIDSQKTHIDHHILPDIPRIWIDNEAMSRVLFNLLDNAQKYSREDANIKLRIWKEQGRVFIEIQDNGIGIDHEEQKFVFDKFYRSKAVQEGNVKGSGIGLTLVAHIIKAHNGSIFLESNEGKGTKVTIGLPIHKRHDNG